MIAGAKTWANAATEKAAPPRDLIKRNWMKSAVGAREAPPVHGFKAVFQCILGGR